MMKKMSVLALAAVLAAGGSAFAANSDSSPDTGAIASSGKATMHKLGADLKSVLHKVGNATRSVLHKADNAVHRTGHHDSDSGST